MTAATPSEGSFGLQQQRGCECVPLPRRAGTAVRWTQKSTMRGGCSRSDTETLLDQELRSQSLLEENARTWISLKNAGVHENRGDQLKQTLNPRFVVNIHFLTVETCVSACCTENGPRSLFGSGRVRASSSAPDER